MQFHHVLILEYVIPPYGLPVKDAPSPDAGHAQFLQEIVVDTAGQVLHRAAFGEDKGLFPVRFLPRHFGINADDLQPLKNFPLQALQAVTVQRRDRHKRPVLLQKPPKDLEELFPCSSSHLFAITRKGRKTIPRPS